LRQQSYIQPVFDSTITSFASTRKETDVFLRGDHFAFSENIDGQQCHGRDEVAQKTLEAP